MGARGDDRYAIEQLKARYCRTLDTKQWDEFRRLFTDDFVSDTTGSGGSVITGADDFVAFVRRTLGDAVTVHQVQRPEIEVTSATTAHGVWAMLDVVRFVPGLSVHGFGHYHEAYENVNDHWLIKASTLTRLRLEIRTPVFGFLVSERMQRRLQRWTVRSTRR